MPKSTSILNWFFVAFGFQFGGPQVIHEPVRGIDSPDRMLAFITFCSFCLENWSLGPSFLSSFGPWAHSGHVDLLDGLITFSFSEHSVGQIGASDFPFYPLGPPSSQWAKVGVRGADLLDGILKK